MSSPTTSTSEMPLIYSPNIFNSYITDKEDDIDVVLDIFHQLSEGSTNLNQGYVTIKRVYTYLETTDYEKLSKITSRHLLNNDFNADQISLLKEDMHKINSDSKIQMYSQGHLEILEENIK